MFPGWNEIVRVASLRVWGRARASKGFNMAVEPWALVFINASKPVFVCVRSGQRSLLIDNVVNAWRYHCGPCNQQVPVNNNMLLLLMPTGPSGAQAA